MGRGTVKLECRDRSGDPARRKHFTGLLTNTMRKVCRRHAKRDPEFRLYLDSMASSYAKADEVVGIAANHVLRSEFGTLPVESVRSRNSKTTPTIQLCDLLLGAVMEAWQAKATSAAKGAVQGCIAEYLGWPALRTDTHPRERKFNIWYFHDGDLGGREVETRGMRLKYPQP